MLSMMVSTRRDSVSHQTNQACEKKNFTVNVLDDDDDDCWWLQSVLSSHCNVNVQLFAFVAASGQHKKPQQKPLGLELGDERRAFGVAGSNGHACERMAGDVLTLSIFPPLPPDSFSFLHHHRRRRPNPPYHVRCRPTFLSLPAHRDQPPQSQL
jgi:hypothetical protein